MNEGKLNINAPLMSVRRSCGTSPSLTETKRKALEKQQALCKSDMTLDQVTEPVAVPFDWEHIPGRPKGNDGSEIHTPNEASITPSPTFPPGKSTKVAKQPLDKESKLENKHKFSSKSNSLGKSVSKIGYDKEGKDEKMKNVEEEEEEEDDDDVYSDALETLSPTESFSMNCSASGVSGLDNLDTNKSTTSSTDKQAQDFMMSRFLHAAKAMTIQPPQYASKKQSVLAEVQPRDFRKLVREEKKSFVNRHITDIVPYTGQFQQEEEDESGDETDDHANISAKGCGLFPRACIRNSLCLLNPVPGTKMENQFSMYSGYEVGKSKENSHIRSYRPAPAIKKAWDAIHKSKPSSGASSPDMQEARKKWTSESNRYTSSGELKHQSRHSPFHRSRAASAAGMSPFRSKPQSSLSGARLLGDSNSKSSGHASFREVLPQGAKKSSYSGSLAIEKTLYIDAVSKVPLSSSVGNSKRIDTVVGKERNSMLDSFQDMKHLKALEENLDCKVLSSVDANSLNLSSTSMLLLMAKEDKAERLTTDQEINQEAMSLQLVQSSFDKDTEINNKQIVVVDNSDKAGAKCVLHPLPPPLPKSPSESWLCHALPLVSLKNSFPHSSQGTQYHAKRQGINRASSYSKWETIVKTSNLHHDHVHCSQELTIYKPKHSKS